MRANYGCNFPATLSDTNPVLVATYQAIQSNPEEVSRILTEVAARHSEELYYGIRALDRMDGCTLTQFEMAARLLYLNRTCFNGLWRVNKKGQNNVPFGKHKVVSVPSSEFLKLCSEALQNTTIACQGYTTIEPQNGDLVYFDPPYVPLQPLHSQATLLKVLAGLNKLPCETSAIS